MPHEWVEQKCFTDDVRRIEPAIPVRGAQGLWGLTVDMEERIAIMLEGETK